VDGVLGCPEGKPELEFVGGVEPLTSLTQPECETAFKFGFKGRHANLPQDWLPLIFKQTRIYDNKACQTKLKGYFLYDWFPSTV